MEAINSVGECVVSGSEVPDPSDSVARDSALAVNMQPHFGPGRRIDVARVGFRARRQTETGRVHVVDVDAGHARWLRDAHA